MKTKRKTLLLWTRSVEDWENDSKLLEKYDFEVIHLPCIETRSLKFSTPENWLRSVKKTLIFSSWRAVKYAVKNSELSTVFHKAEIHSYGEKSARYLESRNFSVSKVYKHRSLEKAYPEMRKFLNPESQILIPGSRKRAFDLLTALQKDGFDTHSLDVYETFFPKWKMTAGVKDSLKNEIKKYAFFASPSACDGFYRNVGKEFPELYSAKAFAIGPSTYNAAKSLFDDIEMCDGYSIESFLESLNKSF